MVVRPDGTENLLRPRDFVDILGTDWPFRVITVFPYLAVTLLPTTASELGRLSEPSLPMALGVAALSITVLGTLVLLAGVFLPTRLRRSPSAVIATLVLIGATRGVIVSAVVDQSGLESHSHLTSRVVLAALTLPILLALISLVVSRSVTSRRQSVTTQSQISDLERNRDQVLADIHSSDTQLLTEVDESLRPAIDAIRDVVGTGSRDRLSLAAMLDDVANDIVRPLSHTLATTQSDFAAKRAPLQSAYVSPGTPTVREQVSAGFVGLGVFLGSGTVLVDLLRPIDALVAAMISGLTVYGIVRAVTLLFGTQRWRYRYTAVLIVALYSVVWIPAHLVNTVLIFPDSLRIDPWAVSIVATPVVGLLYLLIVRGAYVTRNQLVRLDNTRLNVALQLSEARRRAWLRQRHLTHTLHSTIQSRIHAEARLVRSNTGALTNDEKKRVLATIDSVLTSVNDEPPVAVDAVQGIHDMAAFWSGMCDVALDVSYEVVAAAAADSEVAEAIHIVTLEMISNAIRHGNATTISISISRGTPETIQIVASNNGQPVHDDGRPGLGTALYNELAAEWQIESGDAGVTVTAIIAARGNTLVG